MGNAIQQIVCEYRTMFEDVSKVKPNIRPTDDVIYSAMDYAKCITEMCQFMEGYINYRNSGDDTYKDKSVIGITKKFYDGMFTDTSDQSPYRHQMTLADMGSTNATFLECTQHLQTVLESVMDSCGDREAQQLVTMSTNQFKKLAKVYHDDMSLYMWLANGNRHSNPVNIPFKNRVDFRNVKTPVMHRLDQYKSNKGV